ncbi:nucleotidyltransferase [Clostridium brassicae]|uniref:tRNA(Met) cytidine acetate ligase n=1 Tax=Clostridium brassicae TaxID=2999072 RepID=A0ABT4DB05_9CLOT|nr:nucleotidyltransferase [Clostridium brassicae]MCY6959488.1 nucleotidyltransferase [Clostridium brassicae]
MNITAIIAEYNPLHKGHIYHINESKKLTNCDGVLCIMSGNFVQRGVPAIVDKWSRTEMALKSGVDLVIELPVIYSLSSAEFFAQGAVSILNNLGIVKNLCFGSESGDVDILKRIAHILSEEPLEFKLKLKEFLNKGLSFPSARSKALKYFFNNTSLTSEVLSSSNNILGIEYCKSLLNLKSSITPYTIQRQGGTYNSTSLENNFSSATAIRKALKENNSVSSIEDNIPSCSSEILKNLINKNSLSFAEEMFNFLKFKIFTCPYNIENLPDVSEGLHNKIIKSIYKSNSYKELINNIKSKRYTETRINRILCQYFIGFENYDTKTLRKSNGTHARVLGFNEKGKQILKILKTTSSIPIYTKLPKILNPYLSLDIQATKAYSLINNNISPFSDYLLNPVMLF